MSMYHALKESVARPIRMAPIEVIDKTPDQQSQAEPTYGFPGSITVFVSKKSSRMMSALREALDGSTDQIVPLYWRMQHQWNAVEPPKTAEEAIQGMIEAPVYADLLYGGATLFQGLILPQGVDMTLLILAYNGGRLAPEGFTLAEHYKEDSNIELEALIIRTDPPLTKAERAALQNVSEDQAINNVSTNIWCDTTYWAVAAAVVAVGLIVAGVTPATPIAFVAASPYGSNLEQHIAERTIQRLGPAASARALLQARYQVLSNIPSLGKM